MMSEKPISPQLQWLVEAERSRPDAPAEAKATAQTKLAALLGPSAGLGGGEGSGGGSGQHGSGPGAGSVAGAIKGASGLSAAKVVAVFVLGGLVGGGVATAVIRPVERVVYDERAAPLASAIASIPEVPAASAEIVPPAPSATPPSPARVFGSASTRSAPSSSPTARSRDTDLAAERAIIERARSALARGDGQGALVPIAEHEREFARGQLIEEREALAVQALVIAGRVKEATERAARFRKAFPNSLLLPIVDQALR
jgi:hypothetical protein